MLKWFVCPDGVRIETGECLEKCRFDQGRCVSPSTLSYLSRQRPWKGKLSTTQALNGTRLEYLKLKHDYAESPEDKAFALLGSKHHAALEGTQLPNSLQEEYLEDELGSGIPDDLTDGVLYDYKTWGSYKVAKVLGIEMVDEPTGEVYKTGTKKGQPKTKKVPRNTGRRDALEVTIQVNRYRMLYEAYGFEVNEMYVQVTVRDGGTYIAQNRGIDRRIYLIPVRRISDCWIRRFYELKQGLMDIYLSTDDMPPVCKPRERWQGRRCKGFCVVAEFCDFGKKLKAL